MAELLYKTSCPDCGSKDNLAVYNDGTGYCFTPGCGYKKQVEGFTPPTGDMEESDTPKRRGDLLYPLEFSALAARKITIETCRKFGYGLYYLDGKALQVAQYYKEGRVVAQHIRDSQKNFRWIGAPSGCELFGQHLWSAGKMVIVTEGEIDALTVSQLQGNKWPVVSIPNGAAGAKKALQQNIEWLLPFEKVVLMFDEDVAGQDAVRESVPLFPPGKCRIARLPWKDANECLVKGDGDKVISAIWNAQPWRPDGLVTLADIEEDIVRPVTAGLSWCFPQLSAATYGRRYGEIYAVGAGTGVGKTDLLTQQMAYDVTELGQKIGVFFLEQRPPETAKRIAGKIAGKRFHVPDDGWTEAELRIALAPLRSGVTFYDNFGSTDWDIVARHIRYLTHEHETRIFYLDHLTALADPDAEKDSLERIMKEMATLANELNIIIIFVSHLTTPEGKPHEEGGRVTIRHFKGSRAIGFWSFLMFGLERNQQAEEDTERRTTKLRVLKDRYTGQATGRVFNLIYDADTGLLKEEPIKSPFAAESHTLAGGQEF